MEEFMVNFIVVEFHLWSGHVVHLCVCVSYIRVWFWVDGRRQQIKSDSDGEQSH